MKIYINILLYSFYIYYVIAYNYIFNIGSTGLLLPYSLGIIGYIKKNVDIQNYELIGTSGGAYCSLLYKFENDLSNHDLIWKNIFKLTEKTKIDLHNLHKFQKATNNILINRYNDKYFDNKNIKIIATKYNSIINKERIVFDNFDNINDLIYKCYCSSYIPYVSGNSLYYKYKNNKYYDGAFNKENKIKKNYIINEKIINEPISVNNKKLLYINCNMWGRKWNNIEKHYLDYNTSKKLFNNGWEDTDKYFKKIL